ncbi:hypothetical protein RF11_05411 [Thelohanellus kitauei]|uniref:Uncharacterized protein n=1 Tax=Thelohanellus kitauei TaxID=669202 RepID=A0A0C2IAG0_THEKT|nr:hypothetical protein RF11_05411 [Thelohanellus kitauei]
MHVLCKNNSEKSRITQKSYFNNSAENFLFEIDDKVFMRTKDKGKLGPLFHGPYFVAKNLYPDYILYHTSNPEWKFKVHHHLLFRPICICAEPRKSSTSDLEISRPQPISI